MQFSVGSWSFHELYEAGKMNLFGYLESMKFRYHLDAADIWNGMLVSTEDDYIAKVKEALDDEEMTLANLAVDGAQIWEDDADLRDRNHHLALRYLEIGRQLGARTVRIDMGPRLPDMTDEQFEHIVQRYREYAKIAKEHGFRVGPQTHQPAAQVPLNIVKLAKAVDSSAFGIVLDVGRWVRDTETGDEVAAPYTMHVHFDSSRTTTREQLEQEVQILKNANYQGCWSLEYRLGGNEYRGVECDLAELKRAVYALR